MNRRLIAIFGGACVVLLLAWYVLLWSPKGGELAAAKTRQAAATATADQLQVQLARLQSAKRTIPDLTDGLDRVHAAIPPSADLGQFMLDVDAQAKDAGVDFLSIAPTAPAPSTSGGPTSITLNINITGGYFQMLDFTQRLMGLPRLVVIDSMQVTPSGDATSGPPQLTVGLNARMFTTQAPVSATPAAPSAASGAPATGTTPPAAKATGVVTAPPTTTVGATR